MTIKYKTMVDKKVEQVREEQSKPKMMLDLKEPKFVR